MAAGMKTIGAIIGVVGILVGIVAAFGVIPGAAVSTTTGAPGASFNYTVSQLTVSVQDHSTLGGSSFFGSKGPVGTFVSLTLKWGDASSAASETLGFAATHTFAAAGTYRITETLTYKQCNPFLNQHYCTTLVSVGVAIVALTSSGGGAGGSGQSYVNVTFSVRQPAAVPSEVVVTDQSVAHNATISSVTFFWGDGTSSTVSAGNTAAHNFTATSAYTITENVSWTATGGNVTRYSSWSTNVSVNLVNPCQGTCNTTTSSGIGTALGPSSFSFNAFSGLLIVGFLGVLIFSLVPGPIIYRVMGTLAFFLIGFAAGWAAIGSIRPF